MSWLFAWVQAAPDPLGSDFPSIPCLSSGLLKSALLQSRAQVCFCPCSFLWGLNWDLTTCSEWSVEWKSPHGRGSTRQEQSWLSAPPPTSHGSSVEEMGAPCPCPSGGDSLLLSGWVRIKYTLAGSTWSAPPPPSLGTGLSASCTSPSQCNLLTATSWSF